MASLIDLLSRRGACPIAFKEIDRGVACSSPYRLPFWKEMEMGMSSV